MYRNLLITLGSYVFYGWWDVRFLVLVALSTATDYGAALGASGQPVHLRDRLKAAALLVAVALAAVTLAQRDVWLLALAALGAAVFVGAHVLPMSASRKSWLLFSLIVNFGLLFIFKYFNFFVEQGVEVARLLGLGERHFALQIVLPVGLSFFTFQATGRTIDSYCGRYVPQRNLLNYAAFHAFFPQLIAGPIERASHLMPQFETTRALQWADVGDGVLLFLWGLLKKTVVADNVAPYAERVFDPHTTTFTSAEATLAVLAFTFQIYGDFSGYSDMARGLARLLGFDLMRNFNLPYCARSPAEFWRRWHISLSQWLRDFIYIPLGGNRRGEAGGYRNLMLTMALGGVWHGASWSFVVWGLYHGAIQVVYRFLRIDRWLDARRWLAPASWLTTMLLVMIGWVFFRAATLERAVNVLSAIAAWRGPPPQLLPLLTIAAPVIALEVVEWRSQTPDVYLRAPGWVRYHFGLFAFLTVLAYGAAAGPQFLYFDF